MTICRSISVFADSGVCLTRHGKQDRLREEVEQQLGVEQIVCGQARRMDQFRVERRRPVTNLGGCMRDLSRLGFTDVQFPED